MSKVRIKYWHGEMFLGLVVLLALIGGVTRWRLDAGTPQRTDQSLSAFSAESAQRVLANLLADERPHPVDSAANDAVRQRIITALESIGYRAEVQDTLACAKSAKTCARIRNIIAVLDGTAGNKSILASAHYDSVPAGPGASDNGSGVAVLLESARLLKSEASRKNGVIFLFTEGEESGLLGAQAFATEHRLADKVAAVINVEARGTAGRSILFETGHSSTWLISQFTKTSKRPLANSLIPALYTLMPNDTDMSVFKARGVPGLNFAFGEQQGYYHTALDNLSHLDPASLQQQGDNVHDLLKLLTMAELPGNFDTGSVVYTDLLGIDIVRWPAAWGTGAILVLMLAFAFIARRIRRRHAYGRADLVWGLLGGLLAPVLGALFAYALTYLLMLANAPANAWPAGALYNRVLLWAGVLLAVVAFQRLLARRRSPVGLWIGTGAAWLLLALAMAVLLPGGSYLFLIPALVVVVCALLVSLKSGAGETPSLVVLAVPALACFMVTIPAIFLVEIMLDFQNPAGIAMMGALLGMSAAMLLPFAESQQAPKLHALVTVTLSAIFVSGAALALRAPAYTAEAPQGLNMMYVQSPDGKALLTSGNVYNRPPPAVLRAMGSEVALRPPFSWNETRFYSKPVTSVRMPAAALAVLAETPVAQGRRVTARIDAAAGVSVVEILFPKAAGVKSIQMGGQQLDYADSTDDYVAFFCRGDSCNGREITVTLGTTRQSAIVAAISSGLPAAFDTVANSRAPVAIPRGNGDQSMVVSESLF